MNDKLFREKSIKRISSPENLGEYLRVTTPAMWIILAGVAIVLVGLFVWSYFVTIDSYAYGEGTVKDGVLTVTYEDRYTARYVNDDMDVIIGGVRTPIDSVGVDNQGNVISISHTDFPDGNYGAKASYKQTQVISMLFN